MKFGAGWATATIGTLDLILQDRSQIAALRIDLYSITTRRIIGEISAV